MRKIYILLIFLLISFFSCKPTRKTTINIRHINKKDLISTITKNNPSFQNINIKCDLSVVNGDFNNTLKGHIIVKKDSLIWASLNAVLGIEVVRTLFEQDSFQVLNFFNKTVYKGTYFSTKKIIGSELNYNILQNVITGTFANEYKNYLVSNNDTIFENSKGEYILKSRITDFSTTIKIDSKSFKIKELTISKALSPIIMEVYYEKYIKINESLFPQSIIIKTKDTLNQSVIKITYTKIIFNKDFKTPFKIPKKFEIIKLN